MGKKTKLAEENNPEVQIHDINEVLMDDKNENLNINYGDSYLSIKSSYVVELKEEFVIFTKDGGITLEVDIVADLAKVPEEYRSVFINMLTSKYMNKASVVDNSFYMGVTKDEERFNLKKLISKWMKKFS